MDIFTYYKGRGFAGHDSLFVLIQQPGRRTILFNIGIIQKLSPDLWITTTIDPERIKYDLQSAECITKAGFYSILPEYFHPFISAWPT